MFLSEAQLHKKWSFPLRIFSVNMTKSTVSCGFGHIYWRNSWWKTSFFVQCVFRTVLNIYDETCLQKWRILVVNQFYKVAPSNKFGRIVDTPVNLKGTIMQIMCNKYMVPSTEIRNTGIFTFIAVLVFKLLSRKVLFANRNDNRNC